MTESVAESSTEAAPNGTGAPGSSRLQQVLAWVGIVAGILFIVTVVFGSGFLAGGGVGGYGWHRGAQGGPASAGAPMGGGCPMMQKQSGGMGPG